MDIFINIVYYGSIATIIYGSVCTFLLVWALCSKKGKKYIYNIGEKNNNKAPDNKDIEAKGG